MITSGLECGITRYTKELISEISKKHIKVDCVPLNPGIFRFNILRDIIRLKPDIVHIQHEIVMFDKFFGVTSFFIYLYAFLTRRKTVTTFHTVKSLENFENEIADKYRSPIRIPFAKLFIKFSFKMVSLFSAQIIVLTETAKNVLKNEYKIKNVVYIPHGFFDPCEVDNEALSKFREVLGLKSNDEMLLLFGYPFENKGYEYVIKSLPLVLKRHPEAKLVITGGIAHADPEQCITYISELKEMARRLMVELSIIFTDYIPDEDVPYLIMSADVGIFPFKSRQSASGALSTVYPYKKPIIVSDIPVFDFLEDKNDCIKVNVKNEEELAGAINLIFDNPEMSSKLRKNIDRRINVLSIERAAREHMNIYKA
jgi:glycosyltransferase involved in cell wall biosynthesis